ncbi:hypothetical protein Aduo_001648 [Ancylostoma duodenale]
MNCSLFLGSSRLASSLLRAHVSRSLPSAVRIHTTPIVCKVRRTEKIKKQSSSVLHSAVAAAENTFVQGALKEMKDVEVILGEELAKHFSLQVDLRVYEDLLVKLEKGDVSGYLYSLIYNSSLGSPLGLTMHIFLNTYLSV